MDRAALALVLSSALAGCSPGAFDKLTGGERDASGGRSDAGERGDAGASADSSAPAPPMEAGTDDGGASIEGGAPEIDGGMPGCPHAAAADAVEVQVSELGAIAIPSVEQPRIGATARLGARVLWTFNFANTALATWTGEQGDLRTVPMLQAPEPVVPLIPVGVPAGFAPLIGGAVAASESEALIFFLAQSLTDTRGVGLARIALEARQAEVIHAQGELFPPPPPSDAGTVPWYPRFWTGVFVHLEPDGAYVYVYACNGDPDAPGEQPGGANEAPCRLARARLEQAQDGGAYEYWNGRGWVSDVESARIVINRVPDRLSVSYNDYLGKFLAVHSVPLANAVALRWADRPEGPWQTLDEFATVVGTGAFGFTFDAKEQTALRDPCHRVVYVTYLLPVRTTGAGGTTAEFFETRLVRVELE